MNTQLHQDSSNTDPIKAVDATKLGLGNITIEVRIRLLNLHHAVNRPGINITLLIRVGQDKGNCPLLLLPEQQQCGIQIVAHRTLSCTSAEVRCGSVNLQLGERCCDQEDRMTINQLDIEAQIRNRAYELWEEAGRPDGREDEFWHHACAEIRFKTVEELPLEPASAAGEKLTLP